MSKRSAPAATVTRELSPLEFTMQVRAETFDAETARVDCVWTTGARVLRRPLFGDDYYEELGMGPGECDLSLLEGAPVLDSHRAVPAAGVVGHVERPHIVSGEGRATLALDKSSEVYRLVEPGHVRAVSCGYRVLTLRHVGDADDGLPILRAVRWQPLELSLVAIGADPHAKLRSDDHYTPNPVEIEEPTMDDDDKKELAERRRVDGIDAALRGAKITDEAFRKELVDGAVSLDAARAKIIDKLADADQVETRSHVVVGEDRGRRAAHDGAVNALMHRYFPDVPVIEEAHQFIHRSISEIARMSLDWSGIPTRGMSKMDVASVSLNLRAGHHSSSDFPLIVADLAGKMLRRAYTEASQTLRAITRSVTAPDFKDIKRYQLGEAPELQPVIEGGEFKRGTLGEAREIYRLATYGRIVAFTRQLLVNDDMDAFARLVMLFGRSARDLESDLVWAHFLENPVMGDGAALFHASHNNVGTGVIGIAGISDGRVAMRSQRGLDGKQYINANPRTLLVPVALETAAQQAVSAIQANTIEATNPFASQLQVVAEPRLDAASTEEWYLVADPASIDVLEIAYLEGAEAPFFDTRVGFDVDGVELKCRHDFATKAIDHRGLYQSDGQAAA